MQSISMHKRLSRLVFIDIYHCMFLGLMQLPTALIQDLDTGTQSAAVEIVQLLSAQFVQSEIGQCGRYYCQSSIR